MAYDDDESRFGPDWRDWFELEYMLRRYFSIQRRLTIGRTRGLVQSLAELTANKDVGDVTIYDLQPLLERNGLNELPLESAIRVMELVAPLAREGGEVFDRVTLNEIEEALMP